MGVNLKVNFKFPDWAGELEHRMPELKQKAMVTLQTNRGMLFKNEGAYNNHARWRELKSEASLRTNKEGTPERRILQKTGTLKNSIAPQGAKGHPGPKGVLSFTGDDLVIGTQVAYAAIHNFGGTVNIPEIKNGFGRGIRIRAHSIRIPARPFLEGAWNAEDQKELDDTIANAIARILNRGGE